MQPSDAILPGKFQTFRRVSIMSVFRRLASIVAAAVFLISGSIAFVAAQDVPSGNTPGSGLNITPTRTELRIDPGKVDVVSISLKNVSGGDIVARVFVNDFESDDTTGEPRLVTDPDRQLPTTIRQFLVGLGDIDLKTGEQKNFDIPVQIPEGAAPGAYYGVIRYVAVPKAAIEPGAGQVSLTASVGSLVLIEVPGDIKEQIQARGIHIYNRDKEGSIFTKNPTHVGVEVKNTGNTFSKPFGSVVIKNMFGKQIQAYELNNAIPKGNVLPNSTRIFRDELKGVSAIGRYTVSANVSYAAGGDVLYVQKTFWILPLWFIILLVAVLIALLIGGNLLYRKKFAGKRK